MQISTYTDDTVKFIGSCTVGIVHLDTNKLVPVTFYVANNDGSVLLSCKMTLALCLIQPWSRLDYLPPWSSLITSTMDDQKKTKLTFLKVHRSQQEVSAQRQELQSHVMTSMSRDTAQKSDLNIVISSKEQIVSSYPGIFEGIDKYPRPLYHIQVDPNIIPKKPHVNWCLCISKKPSKKKYARHFKQVSSSQLKKSTCG